jgi:hypothetical protein
VYLQHIIGVKLVDVPHNEVKFAGPRLGGDYKFGA